MKIKDLIIKNRSIRRFREKMSLSREQLTDLIELARYSASGRNAQPLKYYISNSKEINDIIFPTLSWAGFLKEWPGPAEGERPAAYILVLLDKSISDNYYCDDGIAMQNILLGAVEKGFGGCILRAINKPVLRKELNIPERFDILDVVALGEPAEKVMVEDISESGDFKYYRDSNGIHHVPKRTIDELIVDF